MDHSNNIAGILNIEKKYFRYDASPRKVNWSNYCLEKMDQLMFESLIKP